jgi:hypothetical protein
MGRAVSVGSGAPSAQVPRVGHARLRRRSQAASAGGVALMPGWTRRQNAFHSDGSRCSIHRVKKKVAPEPSDLTTGVIGRLGSCAP